VFCFGALEASEYKLNKPLFEGVSRFSVDACEWRRRVDFRFFWLLLAMLPLATGSSLQRGKRYPSGVIAR
jgi:hypothetical protein